VAWVLGFEVALGASMPVLREHLGIGLAVASIHLTALAAAGTLSAAISERVTGVPGRGLPFQLSLSLCALGCALIVVSRSALWSIVAVTLFGLGGALIVISAQAELIERHVANAGVAMAEVNIAASTAMIAATLMTGPLVAFDVAGGAARPGRGSS